MTQVPLLHYETLAPAAIVEPIVQAMREARAVQVIGHLRPDGDCIGSMLGLHHLLTHWNVPHAICAEKLTAGGYGELEGFARIAARPDENLNPSLIVFVDCATADRGPSGWRPGAPVVNIDHHASNTRYGQWSWVETRCASAGEMIYYLALRDGAPITPAMADALLVALMTDTGSFRFPNTGVEQYLIAAKLVQAGAGIQAVSRMAYGSMELDSARLTGHVLRSIRTECGGRVAWSEIRKETAAAHGGGDKSPENLSDYLRQVRGVEVCVLFHELETGGLRANLRSNGRCDVSKLAAEWGGGGHPCAAGLSVKNGDYTTLRDRIIERVIAACGAEEN